MLVGSRSQNISGNPAKYGDIYRFRLHDFWGGEWVEKNSIVSYYHRGSTELSKREYLRVVSAVSPEGDLNKDIKAHQKVNSILLAKRYPQFGNTGLKIVYLLLCLQGKYGEKFKEVTTLEEIKKMIGGSRDYSSASDLFWSECIDRILEENSYHRKKMYNFSEKERAIWVRFYRKSAASCNQHRKTIK